MFEAAVWGLGGWGRRAGAWLLTLAVALFVTSAGFAKPATKTPSKPPQRAIGFSNLVFRLDGKDLVGIAKADSRVFVLERLRARGFNAVGAESLVFGQDRGGRAEVVLGGTVRELECADVNGHGSCRVGIEWELLDTRSEQVVYRVLARAPVYEIDLNEPTGVARRLLLEALDSLLRRQEFLKFLEKDKPAPVQAYPEAEYAPCTVPARAMPSGAEAAFDATVLIKTDEGFGSGFFLNAEGYVLTAAHVVADASSITIKRHDGTSEVADLIRISRRRDAALLRVKSATSPCLPLELAPPSAGSDVYAVGSPASEEFAFSVTRGIVSGTRVLDDVPFLQTDASVNPGNSGGPLIDQAGNAAAIVSWKVVAEHTSGIAFGVPVEAALGALSLKRGPATAKSLTVALSLAKAPESHVLLGTPDRIPTLDSEEEARARAAAEWRALQEQEKQARDQRERESQKEAAKQAERERRLDAITPGYVKALKWGGVGLTAVGALTIFATAVSVDDSKTEAEWKSLRWKNDLGFIALGLGVASFGASYVLRPSLPREARTERRLSVAVSAGQVRLGVSY